MELLVFSYQFSVGGHVCERIHSVYHNGVLDVHAYKPLSSRDVVVYRDVSDVTYVQAVKCHR